MTTPTTPTTREKNDRFDLDAQRSRVRLRTYAKGLLSALAHDLELEASPTGAIERDGDGWKATLDVKADAIKVLGVLRRGRVHTDVLSASDVREIERKIREEIFAPSASIAVDVRGTPERPDATFHMSPPRAGSAKAKATIDVKADDEVIEAKVKGTLSMRALGLAEVRGPLGAFVIKDDVDIEAMLVFS
jgi:hypothetical protein